MLFFAVGTLSWLCWGWIKCKVHKATMFLCLFFVILYTWKKKKLCSDYVYITYSTHISYIMGTNSYTCICVSVYSLYWYIQTIYVYVLFRPYECLLRLVFLCMWSDNQMPEGLTKWCSKTFMRWRFIIKSVILVFYVRLYTLYNAIYQHTW